jgi:hypothetical protein
VTKVKAALSFRALVDELDPSSLEYEAVIEVWKRLVEEEPVLEGSRPTRLFIGSVVQDGFWHELPYDLGFVTYIVRDDPDRESQPITVLYQLIFY